LKHKDHIKKKFVDYHFSAKEKNGLTEYSEFWLSTGKIELDNDRTGLLNSVEKLDIISI